VSAGKSLLVSVQSAIRLFAAKAGMRLVAASADIDIKALKDSVNVLAKLNITQTANKITIQAKEEVVINGGSSYSRWSSGGIEHGTSGTWREHAAVHSLVGPASEGKPALPNPPQVPKGQLDLYHQYIKPTGEKHQGVAQGDFTVVDSEGGTHSGTLDRNGFASVAGLPIGTAKVTFGKDPRDPWEEGSYFGTPQDWKGKAPAGGGFDAAGAASGVSGLFGGAGGGAAAALAGVAGTGSKAASLLGQASEAAATAQQAVGAAQAIRQGGAKAMLGQARQAATGMATQAAGARLGPMGAPVTAIANMAGGVAKGGLPAAAGTPALAGRTPGFMG
jgi:type VI secretion system secreted protein VgrG